MPFALEIGQICEAQLVVLRSRGNHDGTRGEQVAAIEHHLVWPAIAVEPHHAARDHHIGAELLRLRGGARRQFQPGDAGRKPR
jgi:hypothetical protein